MVTRRLSGTAREECSLNGQFTRRPSVKSRRPSDNLLRLPSAPPLCYDSSSLINSHPLATLVCIEVCAYSELCARVAPEMVFHLLSSFFKPISVACEQYGLVELDSNLGPSLVSIEVCAYSELCARVAPEMVFHLLSSFFKPISVACEQYGLVELDSNLGPRFIAAAGVLQSNDSSPSAMSFASPEFIAAAGVLQSNDSSPSAMSCASPEFIAAAGVLQRDDSSPSSMSGASPEGLAALSAFMLGRASLHFSQQMSLPLPGCPPLYIRVGLCTGPCSSGVFGGARIPKFSVMGDVVESMIAM
eukprot:gene26080-11784_t